MERLEASGKGEGTLENLTLQNVQARSRMVLSYFLAQVLPWALGDENPAFSNSPSDGGNGGKKKPWPTVGDSEQSCAR